MAISTIGGAATSAGGTVGALGTRLHVSGSCSTGNYAATLPAGDYVYFGNPGATLTLADGTVITPAYNSATTSANATLPLFGGSVFRNPQSQTMTVTTGATPISTRLGAITASNNGASINRYRNRVSWIPSVSRYVFPDSSNNVVWTSADGVSWTSNSISFFPGQCFMVANGILFTADGGFNNNLYYSTNGTSFTSVTLPTATVSNGKLIAVVFASSTYVAVVRTSTGAVHTFTSSNGISWTYGAAWPAPVSTGVGSIDVHVASNGTTIIGGSDGYTDNSGYHSSTNGTTWTSQGGFGAGTGLFLSCIEFLNGNFLVLYSSNGGNNSRLIYSSSGTASWTSTNLQSSTGWGSNVIHCVSGMTWDGSRYLITSLSNSNGSVSNTLRLSDLAGTGDQNAIWSFDSNTSRASYGYSGTANNRLFIIARDAYGTGPRTYLWNCGTSIITPNAPGSFSLYRYHESTVLN